MVEDIPCRSHPITSVNKSDPVSFSRKKTEGPVQPSRPGRKWHRGVEGHRDHPDPELDFLGQCP